MRRILPSAGLLGLVPILACAADKDTDKKGMPQLDPSSYPSQIFWLAVFFAAFYLFMWKFAMPRLHRIIEARQARISSDLNHATTASGDAHDLKAELDRSLGQAREQARTALEAANDEIRKNAAARDAALSAELAAKIEKGEAAIQAARNQALGSIADIAAGILTEAVPRVASITVSDSDARASVMKIAGAKG